MGYLKDKIEVVSTKQGNAVYIGSDIEKAMGYALNNNIKSIIISHDKGYRLNNVDFLKEYTFIERLTIQYYGTLDLDGIHYLNGLKRLNLNVIANDNQSIDFTFFPKLEDCGFTWRPKAKTLFTCKSLKTLSISKFSKENLEDLRSLSNLSNLQITSSSIKSLKGIEDLKLHKLGLYYLSKLESLGSIEGLAGTLKELDIQTCKKINSIKEVASLENLETLGVNNCGDIESIKLIRNLKNLKRFEFWESTNILDGDITPCLNLKEVAFQNRKHYTHTNEEIYKIIKK